MSKKNKKELISFIEDILKQSNVLHYELKELKDDLDINFFVTIKTEIAKEDIEFNFILYCTDETVLTFYCPILYEIKKDDSIMYVLNAINTVNSKVAVGKIYLNNDDKNLVSYINRLLYNDIKKELTVGLFKDYINSFLITSFEFYEQMKAYKND